VPSQIYGGELDRVSRHLREFSAVSDFLATRGIAWRPDEEPGQHSGEEMREYLAEARAAFSDSQVILQALKEYENGVADLLED
jgi:hypothetical protein